MVGLLDSYTLEFPRTSINIGRPPRAHFHALVVGQSCILAMRLSSSRLQTFVGPYFLCLGSKLSKQSSCLYLIKEQLPEDSSVYHIGHVIRDICLSKRLVFPQDPYIPCCSKAPSCFVYHNFKITPPIEMIICIIESQVWQIQRRMSLYSLRLIFWTVWLN